MGARAGSIPAIAILIFLVAAPAGVRAADAAAADQTIENLSKLSIEQLANVEVTSVEKTPQTLASAPAAVYVITHEDIERSGATSLPEILRLAPNLFVARTSAASWVITARGFAGNQADRSPADKLLVLIDGRSVYSPLFSGVFWDMQDLVPEDIERIEVISGPGATLWGANAVNGVINIITRKSYETEGGLVDVTAGTLQSSASIRYGGRLSETASWRAYVRELVVADTVTATGAHAGDHWNTTRGGFRFDWTPAPADAVVLEGDAFAGRGGEGENIEGVLGPHSNAHGPNEFLDIATAKAVSVAVAQVLADHAHSARNQTAP
ncbi:MAG TPA: TonB-dependent receptor plug domain-containing protein [Caulobacteraceae bacterium]|nr:TonB-dependent receptor plug domain-containing protein [Caulobacteraceae bacterium]